MLMIPVRAISQRIVPWSRPCDILAWGAPLSGQRQAIADGAAKSLPRPTAGFPAFQRGFLEVDKLLPIQPLNERSARAMARSQRDLSTLEGC